MKEKIRPIGCIFETQEKQVHKCCKIEGPLPLLYNNNSNANPKEHFPIPPSPLPSYHIYNLNPTLST